MDLLPCGGFPGGEGRVFVSSPLMYCGVTYAGAPGWYMRGVGSFTQRDSYREHPRLHSDERPSLWSVVAPYLAPWESHLNDSAHAGSSRTGIWICIIAKKAMRIRIAPRIGCLLEQSTTPPMKIMIEVMRKRPRLDTSKNRTQCGSSFSHVSQVSPCPCPFVVGLVRCLQPLNVVPVALVLRAGNCHPRPTKTKQYKTNKEYAECEQCSIANGTAGCMLAVADQC